MHKPETQRYLSSEAEFLKGLQQAKLLYRETVAPMFAPATGVGEYFNNEWYVAPVYSLALLDGFGLVETVGNEESASAFDNDSKFCSKSPDRRPSNGKNQFTFF